MNPGTEVSVAIIARDSAATIAKCLKSASEISSDLVVVIDTRTADSTAEIAKKLGARVLYRDFDDFSGQKNFAASKCLHNWIFSLDADEWAGEELISQIQTAPLSGNICAFVIPRKNIIFGRIINHTNWDPDGLIRLYNRKLANWRGHVHESIVPTGPISKLSGPIFHLNYTSVEQFLTRQDLYSTAEAGQRFLSGEKFSLAKALVFPKLEFFRRYIWHAGFLDGWHGFFLSYLMSVYHFSVQVKLWQKNHPAKA